MLTTNALATAKKGGVKVMFLSMLLKNTRFFNEINRE